MIKVLDASFNRLGVVKNVIDCARIEELNGENILDFNAVLDVKLNQLIDQNSIYELDNDYFDTAFLKKTSNEDNTYTVSVESEHVSYRLNRSDYDVEYFTETGLPIYILGKILEGTGFTIGDVEFSASTTYSAQEAKSRRQLLMEFAAYLEGELIFNKFEISIVVHRGSLSSIPVIKDRNVKEISKTINKRELDDAGNPAIAYLCQPIYLPDDVYSLGDEILLMHKDLNINEELRVTRIAVNPYDSSDVILEFANYTNDLANQVYQIETTTVTKNALYNGIRIGPDYGFEAVRNDKKARAFFRSDAMVFQSGDGSGTTWKDRLYYTYDAETDETVLVFDGKLSADVISALTVLITPNLYAEKATISELTVDRLDTSTKVQNYLYSDNSDVNYIRIQNQTMEFVTASTNGVDTEQATNRYSELLYWTDDTHIAASTVETDYPVMTYVYTELVKMATTFVFDGTYYVPMLSLGSGTGVGNNGKSFIYKDADGFFIDYYTNDGVLQYIKITDEGVFFSGFPTMEIDSTTTIIGLVQMWVQIDTPIGAKVNDVWVDTDDYTRYDVMPITGSTVIAIDAPEVIKCTGTLTLTLHAATTIGIIKKVYNVGSGIVTVAGTINDLTNMYLYPGESVELITDGTGWRY